MPNFIVKNTHSAENTIEFEFEFDTNDGDLNLKANGIYLLFISASNGLLHRYYTKEQDRRAVPGLKFDSEGYLELGE
jgi:hypothetical protein